LASLIFSSKHPHPPPPLGPDNDLKDAEKSNGKPRELWQYPALFKKEDVPVILLVSFLVPFAKENHLLSSIPVLVTVLQLTHSQHDERHI
jgi:hypothetical protein